jgi:Family of unknown function (DUF5343)
MEHPRILQSGTVYPSPPPERRGWTHMAEPEARKSYPMLAPSHWWKLRTKFHQSIPGVVTDGYLATVLDMAEASARSNVMPYLKALGLIHQDGKPTDLVKGWRDDESYAAVCKTILEATYPQELIHAIDDAATGRPKAERWFQNKAGVGQNAAGKMASIFMVVYEGDPSKGSNDRKATSPKKATKSAESAVKHPDKVRRKFVPSGSVHTEHNGEQKRPLSGPDVNINLQIHISADASPDQIEQIFLSMSKHLYKNG